MKRQAKIWLGILIGLVALLGVGWGVLEANMHQPSPAAQRASQSAVRTDYGLAFKAKQSQGASVIFYPGALVAPASYSIWAKNLAASGTSVYIVRFPLNLAVLSGNKADRVLKATSGPVVIGGHSLGGVMAARYARVHASNRLAGVFFLASYADEKGRLAKRGLPVLSVTASHDGVLNWSAYRKAKANLPQTTRYVELAGNHAGFGSYGKQHGDGKSPVTNQAQQRAVAQTLRRWLKRQVNR